MIKDREFIKEKDFTNALNSAGFTDYECTVIKSYALKFLSEEQRRHN
jgi:hypothetical protein